MEWLERYALVLEYFVLIQRAVALSEDTVEFWRVRTEQLRRAEDLKKAA
jgi:hypothetical protein